MNRATRSPCCVLRATSWAIAQISVWISTERAMSAWKSVAPVTTMRSGTYSRSSSRIWLDAGSGR